MRVIGCVARQTADAMWVMARIARRIFPLDVFTMLLKTVVVQNTRATVAGIAQRIIGRAFNGEVRRYVVPCEDRLNR